MSYHRTSGRKRASDPIYNVYAFVPEDEGTLGPLYSSGSRASFNLTSLYTCPFCGRFFASSPQPPKQSVYCAGCGHHLYGPGHGVTPPHVDEPVVIMACGEGIRDGRLDGTGGWVLYQYGDERPRLYTLERGAQRGGIWVRSWGTEFTVDLDTRCSCGQRHCAHRELVDLMQGWNPFEPRSHSCGHVLWLDRDKADAKLKSLARYWRNTLTWRREIRDYPLPAQLRPSLTQVDHWPTYFPYRHFVRSMHYLTEIAYNRDRNLRDFQHREKVVALACEVASALAQQNALQAQEILDLWHWYLRSQGVDDPSLPETVVRCGKCGRLIELSGICPVCMRDILRAQAGAVQARFNDFGYLPALTRRNSPSGTHEELVETAAKMLNEHAAANDDRRWKKYANLVNHLNGQLLVYPSPSCCPFCHRILRADGRCATCPPSNQPSELERSARQALIENPLFPFDPRMLGTIAVVGTENHVRAVRIMLDSGTVEVRRERAGSSRWWRPTRRQLVDIWLDWPYRPGETLMVGDMISAMVDAVDRTLGYPD